MITIVAVVTDGRKVLIGKLRPENYAEYGNIRYVFPGGKIDENETLKETAAREVLEETGLHVKVNHLIGERVHPVTRRQILYFHCEKVSGELDTSNPLNDDIIELQWVDIDRLVKFVPTVSREVLSYIKSL